MSGNSYNGFTWAERQKAYDWLKRQWKLGTRQKHGPACDVCGQTQGYLMAHSENYAAPYGPHIGRWSLCYWCHTLIHCRFRAVEIFDGYATMLEGGERFVNVPGPQWYKVQTFLSGRSHPTREITGLVLASPFGPLFSEGFAAAALRARNEDRNWGA